jgi:hypothetical protein
MKDTFYMRIDIVIFKASIQALEFENCSDI